MQLSDQLIPHIPHLRRYALALTGDRGDADDLVQECLMRFLSKPPDWRRVERPRAYLLTALHNLFVGQLNGHRALTLLEDPDRLADRLVSLPAQLDHLRLSDLAAALSALPKPQREVIMLVGVEGRKYREAACLLGVPVGTVMSRLSRGRETLRALVEGKIPNGGKNGAPAPPRTAETVPQRGAKLVTAISRARRQPEKRRGFPACDRARVGPAAAKAE